MKNMAKETLETKNEILVNGKLEGLNYRSENVVEVINNKALKSDLKSYLKAEEDGQKAAWKLVRLIGKMSREIKQDFGSDYAFAEFMGMSQSVINKRKRLAEFAILLEQKGYTDSKAYELLPLIKKLHKIEKHEDRLEAFKQLLETLSPDMTQKEIREAVKNLDILVDEEKQTAEIEIKEDETPEENETSEEKEETEEIIDFTKMYNITVPIVNAENVLEWHEYQVSGEVLKAIADAISDVIGDDI